MKIRTLKTLTEADSDYVRTPEVGGIALTPAQLADKRKADAEAKGEQPKEAKKKADLEAKTVVEKKVEELKKKYPDLVASIDKALTLVENPTLNNYIMWLTKIDNNQISLTNWQQKYSKGVILNFLMHTKNLNLKDFNKWGWLTAKNLYSEQRYNEEQFKYVWNVLTQVSVNPTKYFKNISVSWLDFTEDRRGVKFFPANIAGKLISQKDNPEAYQKTIWGKVDILQQQSRVNTKTFEGKTMQEIRKEIASDDLGLSKEQFEKINKLLSQYNDTKW